MMTETQSLISFQSAQSVIKTTNLTLSNSDVIDWSLFVLTIASANKFAMLFTSIFGDFLLFSGRVSDTYNFSARNYLSFQLHCLKNRVRASAVNILRSVHLQRLNWYFTNVPPVSIKSSTIITFFLPHLR